jgi:heme/copper-type cytochrome/quinol oxidase subunit 2
MNQRYRSVISCAGLTVAIYGLALLGSSSARAQGVPREFTVNGNHFAFAPPTIEVQKDDLVKISFTSTDIPHSFTIEKYRISKRAGVGQTVVFEFRADQVGTFDYYCDLTQDERCRTMKGKLVVR